MHDCVVVDHQLLNDHKTYSLFSVPNEFRWTKTQQGMFLPLLLSPAVSMTSTLLCSLRPLSTPILVFSCLVRPPFYHKQEMTRSLYARCNNFSFVEIDFFSFYRVWTRAFLFGHFRCCVLRFVVDLHANLMPIHADNNSGNDDGDCGGVDDSVKRRRLHPLINYTVGSFEFDEMLCFSCRLFFSARQNVIGSFVSLGFRFCLFSIFIQFSLAVPSGDVFIRPVVYFSQNDSNSNGWDNFKTLIVTENVLLMLTKMVFSVLAPNHILRSFCCLFNILDAKLQQSDRRHYFYFFLSFWAERLPKEIERKRNENKNNGQRMNQRD